MELNSKWVLGIVIIIAISFFLFANINIKADFDDIKFKKIRDCYPKVDRESNYTCNLDVFNFTPNPKIAYCWEWSEVNQSYNMLYSHRFQRWDIPTQTIWWNNTVSEAYCVDTGKANGYLNKSGTVHQFMCDYSAWGNCGMNDGKIECDSRYDGNADGKCDGGESCIRLDLTTTNVKKIKKAYRELNFDNFGIKCQKV